MIRRAITALLVAVTAGGASAALVISEAGAAAQSQALVCARPANPTVNQVVQTVCSRFGP